MYFDTNESKSHLEAKEKLFDLITSKRVKIADQDGNVYDVFSGKHDDEFLHMESFIMNYSSDAIFSNKESPCKKFMENKNPGCNMEGYFGAFKELPCEKCIVKNFRKYIEGSSKYASYRPDVSFGYEGKHKIWLEIKNESPCSKNKIEFCKSNGIVLLEIDSTDINGFKSHNGKLLFNRLEEYVHTPSIYEDTENILKFIREKLNEEKFIPYEQVVEKFADAPSNSEFVTARNIIKFKERLEKEFNIILIEGSDLKRYFNVKRKQKALISKIEYDKLIENKYINEITQSKDGIKIIEKSDSIKSVRCYKCKQKDEARNFIKTEVTKKDNKKLYRYYHEDCLYK